MTVWKNYPIKYRCKRIWRLFTIRFIQLLLNTRACHVRTAPKSVNLTKYATTCHVKPAVNDNYWFPKHFPRLSLFNQIISLTSVHHWQRSASKSSNWLKLAGLFFFFFFTVQFTKCSGVKQYCDISQDTYLSGI